VADGNADGDLVNREAMKEELSPDFTDYTDSISRKGAKTQRNAKAEDRRQEAGSKRYHAEGVKEISQG